MKKIWIQTFIVIIGILLCIAGYNGVKKYFYNNYIKETKHIIAYNNYSNISFKPNIIETTTTRVVITEPANITTKPTTKMTTTKRITTKTTTKSTTASTTKQLFKSTTTKKITTTSATTTLITTTTSTPDKVFENIFIEPTINYNNEIIYDGMTLKELTDKLNKNLSSTLTNTGHYFAEYYVKTGLDPYLAVAIVLQETGCKWTCSKLVRNCNNVGGMKGTPSCNGGSYRKYETLEEGIYGYLDMLYKYYYSKGLTTPELINPKYATSTAWSENVNKYIENIKKS